MKIVSESATLKLCIVLLTLLFAPLAVVAQDVEWRTTDDTRRVPLPPVDISLEDILLIQGGTLIDGGTGKPIPDAVVVIQGDRIIAAGASQNVTIPPNVSQLIDASGQYIVPGLIDLHTHFTQQRGEDFSRYRNSDVAAAIRATLLLDQYLDAGITTVRDVGTSNDVALRIKEAVERNMLEGPRVLWSGKIIATRGGHGDEITSTATGRPKSMAPNSRVRVADGPWAWREAVREQIRMHADWIKVSAPFTKEEIQAAIDEAHLHGIPVTADSFGEFTQWASEAGIDSIEHPLNLNSEVIAAMAQNKTDLVPTLTAFYNVLATGYPAAGIPAGGFYYTMSRRFPVDHDEHIKWVGEAHKAGIRIGVGTDIPFENEKRYPSDYYVELGFLKDAGLSNREVFESATRVGAEILQMGDKLGTIEPGKLADVLIVGSNPLDDIQNLRDVKAVIADGKVVR